MYIELNDKKGSIINLEYAISMQFDDQFKRIRIVYGGTRSVEETYVYDSVTELFNDKHRIKNKIRL